ncbi:MAG TPA: hypothetical protein VM033_01500, partial [Gemmatimonadaceae bacterium]|nr:hypothetical protein [Gemmatimonadaceae bacterium]
MTAELVATIPRRGGRAVSVAIRSNAQMRGGRAMLALRRAAALGSVSSVRPPIAAFDREEFDGRFTFRLESQAADDVIATAVRAAGDVDQVTFADAAAERPDAAPSRGRQIRVDLRRLDAMMKQVGELVVARNRLVDLAAGRDDETLATVAERVGRLVTDLQA